MRRVRRWASLLVAFGALLITLAVPAGAESPGHGQPASSQDCEVSGDIIPIQDQFGAYIDFSGKITCGSSGWDLKVSVQVVRPHYQSAESQSCKNVRSCDVVTSIDNPRGKQHFVAYVDGTGDFCIGTKCHSFSKPDAAKLEYDG